MKSYKNILKKLVKRQAVFYFFCVVCFFIGVVVGATYYVLVEQGNKECDKQFISGCMSAGLSEEICKGRVY